MDAESGLSSSAELPLKFHTGQDLSDEAMKTINEANDHLINLVWAA